MLRNIGKILKILSLVLAGLFFAAFLTFGILFLCLALADGVNPTLRTAGIEAGVLCFVLSVLIPCFCTTLYGFGVLIVSSEKRTDDIRETKELLKKALGEGLLADDIARRMSSSLEGKLASSSPVQQMPSSAPIQRPVTELADTEQTAAPVSVACVPAATEEEAPTEACTKQSSAPADLPPAIRPLRPVGTEEQF